MDSWVVLQSSRAHHRFVAQLSVHMRQLNNTRMYRDAIDENGNFITEMHIAIHRTTHLNATAFHFISIDNIVAADGVDGHTAACRFINRVALRETGWLHVTVIVIS